MDSFTYDVVQLSSNVTVDSIVVQAANLDEADAELASKEIPPDCTTFLSGIEIDAN